MCSNYHNDIQKVLSYEALSKALFENYECLYAIDIETSAFQCFHESESYSSLQIEEKGENFFEAIKFNILRTIYFEDQKLVREKLSREAILEGLDAEKYYSFIYRLLIDGKPLYHKLRATKDIVNGRPHILLGIRNVDEAFRKDKSDAEKISSMHQKEKNHLEAILASASGYLEANLTKDYLLEISPILLSEELSAEIRVPTNQDQLHYNEFEKWLIDNLIIENREKYMEISDRDYLIDCFRMGEKRASVSFSAKISKNEIQPYKKVFYLYQDEFSGDIYTFSVIYNLTEQQRKEKELKEMEYQLQMSRIHNSASQIQPHFLYNVLGSLQEIVLIDPEYASELLGDFSTHLRGCIRAIANGKPIPFIEELENIKAYVNIEKMRFGNKLCVKYDLRTTDFKILPLSIQPIVENAIRHGIYNRGIQGGTVTLRTEHTGDQITITVSDTGVGFDVQNLLYRLESGESDSTGLQNIIFRLDKRMNARVNIDSEIGIGTKVTVNIPVTGGSK